jgi:hypothetical protein
MKLIEIWSLSHCPLFGRPVEKQTAQIASKSEPPIHDRNAGKRGYF